jgi:hypothetical protein
MLMRAKSLGQQLIAFKHRWSISGQHQMHFKTKHCPGRGSHSTMI